MKIFSGRANPDLAQRISTCLGEPLGRVQLHDFADGEMCCKIEEDVRGRDIFIVQPTCPPVNQSLMELLIMVDSFKRASARRITAVIPYYGYARQDRKDEGRVPITAKLVANLITRSGVDRVLAMDLHTHQLQGFFDIPVDHLNATPVIDGYFLRKHFAPDDFVVVSPDEGSIKRILKHQERLGGKLAIVDKRRSGAKTAQENLIGASVEGKIALIFDDMIATGGSIAGAARMVHEAGAREIYLATTHGIFCGNAFENLKNAPVKEIVITDTIPLDREAAAAAGLNHIRVLSVAALLGDAIRRIHNDESVSQLFLLQRDEILIL
ncbi:MAG: ribose-phosphate pyrophosphokinase [Planctomycetia bacterium]|nr:ribose-phosphate pyrophosphokinase [Planctomycetia bacterium]